MVNPRAVLRKVRKFRKRNLLYQDFYVGDHHYIGSKNTTAQFYSLDIAGCLQGRSFLDLGCNVGGLVFLAEQAGAARSVGIESNSKLYDIATSIKSRHALNSDFENIDIKAYTPSESFDYVTCMAVARHVFGQILMRHVPDFRQPSRFLENNPMDVLIRHTVPYPRVVYEEYDELLKRLVSYANRRFAFSVRDQSGLLVRRSAEIGSYMRSLDQRVESVEVFSVDRTLPYYAISASLSGDA
jgi:SAM-dependent methyltransferase